MHPDVASGVSSFSSLSLSGGPARQVENATDSNLAALYLDAAESGAVPGPRYKQAVEVLAAKARAKSRAAWRAELLG